jgi:outer membrane lipoprotein-sorting protein
MRKVLLGIIGALFFVVSAHAQTADEIIAKYIQKIGGMEKLQAIKTMRATGKFSGGGGFEAVVVDESRRPNMQRNEFRLQGLTGVTAFDGKTGWKIEPWQGKKDAESLSEDELKGYLDGDFDESLINYKQKNIKVEYLGKDEVEGSDVFKLKATLPSGTVKHYYMDTDYYVPIKIETRRTIRGAEVESEAILGDYKEVAGVYFPHSYEVGAKGSQNKAKITYEKIEANIALDDKQFVRPTIKAQTPQKAVEDAQIPKTNEKKTNPAAMEKPPVQNRTN